MELSFTREQEALRRELRAWLRRNLPARERQGRSVEYGDPERVPAAKAWQRRLYEAGWLAVGWPKEHGGRGGTSQIQKNIISERGLGMPR